MTASILRISLSAALASLAASVSFAAATVPMGAVVTTFTAAASPASPTLTAFTPLLRDSVAPSFVGASAGVVASVAAGTGTQVVVTVTGAAWDPLQFRVAASPYFIRFMSGASEGRTLLIPTNQTTNTATTLNADHQSLTVVGSVAPGDKFEIFPADTVTTFFADLVTAGSIITGANASVADNVMVLSGSAWLTYFYHTDGNPANNGWRIQASPSVSNPQPNVVLRPDSGYLFRRRSTSPLSFTTLGTVPATAIKVVTLNNGLTFVGNVFPVTRQLGTFGVETVPGWVSGNGVSSPTGLDRVQLLSGSAWLSHYYDTNTTPRWEISGSAFTANLAVGRPMMISRLPANPAGRSAMNFPRPYSLD